MAAIRNQWVIEPKRGWLLRRDERGDGVATLPPYAPTGVAIAADGLASDPRTEVRLKRPRDSARIRNIWGNGTEAVEERTRADRR